MKKLLALILSVLMIFTIVSCGKSPRGEISSATNDTVDTEAEFGLGTSNANTYKNEFFGIGCTLGSEWTFKTDDEIKEINNFAADMVGDEYKDALKNAVAVTDMYATHSNQTDTINVTFEKLSGANLLLEAKDYIESQKDGLISAFESMGMENMTVNITEGDFVGNACTYTNIEGEFQGVKFYECLVTIKCNNYFANITVCTWQTNGCEEILSKFYSL